MVADHNPGVSFPQLVLGKKSEIREIAEIQNCTVMVDDVVVGYAANFLEAIGIYFVYLLCFQYCYPKEIEKSLTFLQICSPAQQRHQLSFWMSEVTQTP